MPNTNAPISEPLFLNPDGSRDMQSIVQTAAWIQWLQSLTNQGNTSAAGIVSPATTVTDETSFGVAKVVGTKTTYAREDHNHGSPAAPTVSGVATVYDSGTIGGSGTQDLTTNGTVTLDGNTHKGYYGELVVDGANGASALSIRFENDSTAAHYANDNNFGVPSSSNVFDSIGNLETRVYKFWYTQTPAGTAAAWFEISVVAGGGVGKSGQGNVVTQTFTIANITRIDFHSSIANGFGPNSRLRIWSFS